MAKTGSSSGITLRSVHTALGPSIRRARNCIPLTCLTCRHWVLQTLYALYEHKDVQYGRIYNRRNMCRLVVTITVAMELQQGLDVGNVLGVAKLPISEWGAEEWEDFREFLTSTANDLLRQDADTPVSEGENEESHEARGKDMSFLSQLEELNKRVMVLQGVSPLQESLITLLGPDCKVPDHGILPIDKKTMQAFW
jgi:hypothetical protein